MNFNDLLEARKSLIRNPLNTSAGFFIQLDLATYPGAAPESTSFERDLTTGLNTHLNISCAPELYSSNSESNFR
jgi:hypothetical protein